MPLNTPEFVVNARWVIPVIPARTCLENHALVVADGRIKEVMPAEQASQKYAALPSVNLDHHILIPGLINAHGHAAMALLRGYADDKELMDWLENHMWPAEARFVSEEFVRDGTELAVAEMIRTGTTFHADSYWFPNVTSAVYAETGFRAQVCLPLIQFPNAWAQTENEHIDKARALHAEIAGDEFVTTAIAPHAPYTVSDEGFRMAKAMSDDLGIPVHLHLHETRVECDDAMAADGKRPFARIDDLGLMGSSMQTVHMTQLNEAEIERLAATGTHVVHCPESNLKLASGFCPIKSLLDAGVNVGLGTDSAASNNNLDMLEEMRTAALLAKGVSLDPTTVDAFTALEMATINGARMMGLGDKLGSLETGKLADLTAIDVSDIEFQPMHHPISQLVYTASGNQVSDVWIGGQHLLEGGHLTRIDESDLRARVRDWQEKMSHG